ncbi:MAG TPA: DNA repair exonuclease [archaeon]|nr:DNA repair exonuclease [archaeon]
MKPLKFIHTADLHLDSPFTGLRSVNTAVAGKMQAATFSAFEEVVSLALREEVDFVLVAGDIYDGQERSLLAQLRFRKELQRLSDRGIRSFVVHGNHDPLDGWSASLAWPENVHIFSGEKVESVPFHKDGAEAARIFGISYPHREVRENLIPRFKREKGVPFAIGLVHCNLGANTGHEPYAPCSLSDLEEAGFDYWALGHVHTRRVYELRGKALAVYPGNTQGRHPGEKGPHGAVLVKVDPAGRIGTDFLPADSLRWEITTVDISGLAGEDELIEALDNRIAEIKDQAEGRDICLRLSLEGRGVLHSVLQRPGVLSDLESSRKEQWAGTRPLVWIERLEDRTRPAVDLEKRRRSDDFVAGLLEEFDLLRAGCGKDRDEVFGLLKDLFHSMQVRKLLGEPDDSMLENIIQRAEMICIDRLLAGVED